MGYHCHMTKSKLINFRGKTFDSTHFLNRDTSWLDFNYRVLNEAIDPRTPLLERLKFIDIYRSNTDEFFMKRVGSLLEKMSNADTMLSIDNTPFKTLYKEFQDKVQQHISILDKSFNRDISVQLRKENIHLVRWQKLNASEKAKLGEYFQNNIFPLLTPLAVDLSRPFPFLSNLSKSIALCMRKENRKKKHFARVKVPKDLPQWIELESAPGIFRFVSIDDVISHNIHHLFEGMVIESMMFFRITRNASVGGEDEEVEDLLEMAIEGVRVRKFAPVVRMEYEEGSDPWLVNFLKKELKLTNDLMYPTKSYLHYTNFSDITDLKLPHLKYKPFKGKKHPSFKKDIFKEIAKKDLLLHFPYQSYTESVEKFLHAAVYDPRVKAIKMTLYRTDKDGRLINLLIKAANLKKEVACIIELQARFDEEQNIKWAGALEEAGIHVSYGLATHKTHAKMILVIRKERNKLKPYLNIGTGNYNSQTSKLYTDHGLFTSDPNLCEDALYVFNYLTGRSESHQYKELLVAPFNMHKGFIELIQREIDHVKSGKEGLIIAKMNSLEDPEIIEALYRASQAGVRIDLIVRGFCTLKSQIKGLSENISVYSLIGRLLEHSRVYYFRNGKKEMSDGDFYIGSADWMHRNLFNRIEVIAPIKDKSHKKKVLSILESVLNDNRHLWLADENSFYKQRKPKSDEDIINAQASFIAKG